MKEGDGVLRILRDVTVERGDGDEMTVMSIESAHRGQVLTLERIGKDGPPRMTVRVVESRLAVVHGKVRHVLRLVPADAAKRQASGTSEREDS